MKQQEAESIHVLLTDIKCCTIRRDLLWGRKIHAKAAESRNDKNMYVVRALINMYAKSGSMVDARLMFDSVREPDAICWNTLLLGYADKGEGTVSLDMFFTMKTRGCSADPVTYIAVLKACASLAANGDGRRKADCLKQGRQIHSEIGCHLHHFVQNVLIDMYAKCGSMSDASVVFESVQKPDVVSWNTLILGYAENGEGLVALEMFSRMKGSGCVPNSVTYLAAFKACTSLAANGDERRKQECLKQGREIHSQICGDMSHKIHNTLIDMYAKCGSMVDARFVFDSVQSPDVVSWNALLFGYANNGDGFVTLEMFSRLRVRGYVPNSVTYLAAFKACASLAVDGIGKEYCLKAGRQLHSQIGFHLNRKMQNSLIDMYAKCGSMVEAQGVFDSLENPNVVSWTVLLLGYAENGDGLVALELFSRMRARDCKPDSVAYVAALKACCLMGALALGQKLHSEISEVTSHILTCLVDFYAKCGNMIEARGVFDSHSKKRDASTWNALLTGYGGLGESDSVFKLLEAMQDEGFRPNAVTFVCILWCCSHTGLVQKGMEYFEAMTVQYGVTPSVMHYTCMVDILGRANQLNEATAMILKMPCNPNAVTWTSLLGACHKWKNVKVGNLAFQCLVDIDKNDASAYAVMVHIYGSVGMWDEQERVFEMKTFGNWKLAAQAYVMDETGTMIKFAGDSG